MAAAGWAVTSSDTNNMHLYNTRFAAMNRSFAPAVYEESDDEYVPSVGDWDTSAGRRPVTRSMTRGSSAQQQQPQVAPVATRLAAVNTRIRNMIADLESVSSRTRSSASRGSSRASAAPTVSRNTHPMMLRSSRR